MKKKKNRTGENETRRIKRRVRIQKKEEKGGREREEIPIDHRFCLV